MSLYMSTFEYKPEVWSELISNPENRTETVGRLLESAGCKLKGLWYAFGQERRFRPDRGAEQRDQRQPDDRDQR